MATFGPASLQRLRTCDSRLIVLAQDAIVIQEHVIITGHRNEADQEKAFVEKKTKLHWPHGNHNAIPSRAIDIAPVYYEAGMKIDWGDVIAFGRIAGIYQACAHRRGIRLRFGLDWDGDFRSVGRDPGESFLDAPHVELLDS
jgi:hypothetical protein